MNTIMEEQFRQKLLADNRKLIDNFEASLKDPNTGHYSSQILTKQYMDGGKYLGEMLNDHRHGYGIYYYPRG